MTSGSVRSARSLERAGKRRRRPTETHSTDVCLPGGKLAVPTNCTAVKRDGQHVIRLPAATERSASRRTDNRSGSVSGGSVDTTLLMESDDPTDMLAELSRISTHSVGPAPPRPLLAIALGCALPGGTGKHPTESVGRAPGGADRPQRSSAVAGSEGPRYRSCFQSIKQHRGHGISRNPPNKI